MNPIPCLDIKRQYLQIKDEVLAKTEPGINDNPLTRFEPPRFNYPLICATVLLFLVQITGIVISAGAQQMLAAGLFVSRGRFFRLESSRPFFASRGRISGAPHSFVDSAPTIGVG